MENPTIPYTNINDFFQQMTVLFFSVVLGILLFVATIVYITEKDVLPFEPLDSAAFGQTLTAAVLILGLMAIWLSKYLYLKRLAQIAPDTPLMDKLQAYRSAFITRFTVFEGGIFFAVLAYMLTENYFPMFLFLILLGLFFFIRPTREMVAQDLNLSGAERDHVMTP